MIVSHKLKFHWNLFCDVDDLVLAFFHRKENEQTLQFIDFSFYKISKLTKPVLKTSVFS